MWYLYYVAAIYIMYIALMVGLHKKSYIGIGFVIATVIAFPFLLLVYRLYLNVTDTD